MRVLLQNRFLLFIVTICLVTTGRAYSQARPGDYAIKKVTLEFINTPEYQFTGTQRRASTAAKWMEIETEFEAKPEFTEELTFTYYVEMNRTVFSDSVTHVDIAASKELHSVIYMSPRALARIADNKPLSPAMIGRVSVVVSRQGAVVGFGSLKNEKQGWWESLPKKEGFLRNKTETPFAPLYWDRYEAIKVNAR